MHELSTVVYVIDTVERSDLETVWHNYVEKAKTAQ